MNKIFVLPEKRIIENPRVRKFQSFTANINVTVNFQKQFLRYTSCDLKIIIRIAFSLVQIDVFNFDVFKVALTNP